MYKPYCRVHSSDTDGDNILVDIEADSNHIIPYDAAVQYNESGFGWWGNPDYINHDISYLKKWFV